MIIVLFILWISIHSLAISYYGITDNYTKADCILILGTKINPDGSLSGKLKSRVDKGLELYQQGAAPLIIVSGGLGKEGYVESHVMANYLKAKGIPENAIQLDDRAKTTFETMTNFIPMAREHRLHSVIVVSQYYHLYRSVAMLRHYNFPSIMHAQAPCPELMDWYAIGREFVAYSIFKLQVLSLSLSKS